MRKLRRFTRRVTDAQALPTQICALTLVGISHLRLGSAGGG